MKSDRTSQDKSKIVSQMVGCKYQIEPTKKSYVVNIEAILSQ